MKIKMNFNKEIEDLMSEHRNFVDSVYMPVKAEYSRYLVYNRGELVEELKLEDDKPPFFMFKKKYEGTNFQVIQEFDKDSYLANNREYQEKMNRHKIEVYQRLQEILEKKHDLKNDILFQKALSYTDNQEDFIAVAENYEELSEILK